MEEELTRAKESVASMATRDQQSKVVKTKQKATPEPTVVDASKTGTESAQVLKALREELGAQEALREKEREQRKLGEEEERRIEESLRKSHANNDRLKEEREKLQQEKDKLSRQAETEIELRQQKDRDNRLRGQLNRRLKQKTEDFDRLYRAQASRGGSQMEGSRIRPATGKIEGDVEGGLNRPGSENGRA